MPKISAYILSYNEAEKIEAAVSSVLWADEVVVVDSFSTDRTGELATALGARVVQVAFNGFGELRNRAVEACQYEWIFSLDSDERCTEAVRDEILSLLSGSPARDVYRVPRPNYNEGPPHPRLGLVSEFSSAAALSQGRDALHARAG